MLKFGAGFEKHKCDDSFDQEHARSKVVVFSGANLQML
jgi:hypothetical protein